MELRRPDEDWEAAFQDQPIDRLLLPFRLFVRTEMFGGILLIAGALAALVWANSPWQQSYFALWEVPFGISVGDLSLKKPLLIWINDGLMSMFFFVIGLEIKREAIVGELSSFRLASLPIAGAVGGMLAPAAVFMLFNIGTSTSHGWGIPMATDIAFALGIVAILGKRVPPALKVFLVALAVVDDLGAVLVIAFFYTSELSFSNLAIGAGFVGVLIAANLAGVRSVLIYALLGIGGLWLAFLLSGVHPTVAGVLAALCIPARSRIDSKGFIEGSQRATDYFERSGEVGGNVLTNRKRQAALLQHKLLYEGATTPLQRIEKVLHPWAICVVLPVFALANAGVNLDRGITDALGSTAGLGIFLGLLVGKQTGIFLGAWFAVKARLAVLPERVTWSTLYGVSWLGGIGFTMSLFIASLAFEDRTLLANAKVAVLTGSLLSAIGGYWILNFTAKRTDPQRDKPQLSKQEKT